MKRFYKEVRSEPQDGGFAVLLDDRPMRTPGGLPLEVPAFALAQAIVAEWDSVADTIKPLEMMQTRLSNTALDRASTMRGPIIEEAAVFSETDLVCFRADRPQKLVSLQAEHWDPVVEWLGSDLSITLTPTTALLGHTQSPESLAAIRAQLEALNAFEVTAMHALTTLSGSIAIAFAHAFGPFSLQKAWDAAIVDEAYQFAEWGKDAEAAAALQNKYEQFLAASSFWHSVQPDT